MFYSLLHLYLLRTEIVSALISTSGKVHLAVSSPSLVALRNV